MKTSTDHAPLSRTGAASEASADSWLGRLLRSLQPSRTRDDDGIDPATGLLDADGLVQHGDRMLARAQRDGTAVSVVLLDFSDLAEVRSIYGRPVAREALVRVVRSMRAIAGRQGVAARIGSGRFFVALPASDHGKALAAVQRVLGSPSRIEFDAGEAEIVLVPEILVRTSTADTESVDELRRELERQLLRHREHQARREVYLQRERERHSQPMMLDVPPTVPVPLRRVPEPVRIARPALQMT